MQEELVIIIVSIATSIVVSSIMLVCIYFKLKKRYEVSISVNKDKDKDEGYAIYMVGYQRNQDVYKGYVGDGFYASAQEAELFTVKQEVLNRLKRLRRDYSNSPIEFSLHWITKSISISEVEE